MNCPFCTPCKFASRVFWQNDRWIAFLAAPYHTRGHTILALKSVCSVCPRVDVIGWDIIECLGTSLAAVASYLTKYYKPKDVLLASVRGDVAHFHCHLLPLWEAEEEKWRKERCADYEKGHLVEFMGYLEKRGDKNAKRQREEKGWDHETQRQEVTRELNPDVQGLRQLTGYLGP